MKRLTVFSSLALVACMTFATPAHSTIIPVEEAVETASLEISLQANRTGTVAGRSCDQCERRSFRVTRETRAFRNNQPVDIRAAQEQRGKPATIIYNLESGHATKILWSQ